MDVDEEFLCFRYVDPETNAELENVPKSMSESDVNDADNILEDSGQTLDASGEYPKMEGDAPEFPEMEGGAEFPETEGTVETDDIRLLETEDKTEKGEAQSANEDIVAKAVYEPRLTKQPFFKRRHFHQLFIKGDNVVCICKDPFPPLLASSFYLQCKNKYVELKYHSRFFLCGKKGQQKE